MTKSTFKDISAEAIDAIALRFRALGEVNRLYIIRALQSGEKSVTDIVKITGLSQPNVSRHLSVLVTAGIVGRRKDGLSVFYRVIDKNMTEVCAVVCRVAAAESARKAQQLRKTVNKISS